MPYSVPDHIVRRLELSQRRIERDLGAIAIESGMPQLLTNAQSRLLQMIPPQGITATELAGHARITKQGLGQMVDLLEDRGLVRRRADSRDRRSRIIERTARGHQAFDAINVVMRQLEQHLEQVLGAESYAALWAALCELSRDEIDPYTDLGSESATDDGQRPDNT